MFPDAEVPRVSVRSVGGAEVVAEAFDVGDEGLDLVVPVVGAEGFEQFFGCFEEPLALGCGQGCEVGAFEETRPGGRVDSAAWISGVVSSRWLRNDP